MNRSPWSAVLWTVIVMVAAALSTYLPWNRVAPPAALAASGAWARASSRAGAWLAERRCVLALAATHPAPRGAAPAGVWTGAAGALVLAAAAGTLVRRARSRRRPRVRRMAGSGEPLAEIARRNGLSQDAVRLMLSPMVDPARSSRPRGTSFRSGAAAAAAPLRRGPGRAGAS